MATPIPTAEQQLARYGDIDAVLAMTEVSETKVAVRAVIAERMHQVLAGYDAAHDAEHGVDHLVREAHARLQVGLDAPSWKTRVDAAALLIASLEAEAYADTKED